MEYSTRQLDRLEQKIERLRREYDLFLAGNILREPTALRTEVEREILQFTRLPFASTALRFRVKTLAYRFRAVETQVRNLLDRREKKKLEESTGAGEVDRRTILLDQAALGTPAAMERHLRRLHQTWEKELGEGGAAPSYEIFRDRVLAEARSHLAKPGVKGVRFELVAGERGPKLRGEEVVQKEEDESGG